MRQHELVEQSGLEPLAGVGHLGLLVHVHDLAPGVVHHVPEPLAREIPHLPIVRGEEHVTPVLHPAVHEIPEHGQGGDVAAHHCVFLEGPASTHAHVRADERVLPVVEVDAVQKLFQECLEVERGFHQHPPGGGEVVGPRPFRPCGQSVAVQPARAQPQPVLRVVADVDDVVGVHLVEVHRLKPGRQLQPGVDVVQADGRLPLQLAVRDVPVDAVGDVEVGDVAWHRHDDPELPAGGEGEKEGAHQTPLPVAPPSARPPLIADEDQVLLPAAVRRCTPRRRVQHLHCVADAAGLCGRVADAAGLCGRVADAAGLCGRVVDAARLCGRVVDAAGLCVRVGHALGIPLAGTFSLYTCGQFRLRP